VEERLDAAIYRTQPIAEQQVLLVVIAQQRAGQFEEVGAGAAGRHRLAECRKLQIDVPEKLILFDWSTKAMHDSRLSRYCPAGGADAASVSRCATSFTHATRQTRRAPVPSRCSHRIEQFAIGADSGAGWPVADAITPSPMSVRTVRMTAPCVTTPTHVIDACPATTSSNAPRTRARNTLVGSAPGRSQLPVASRHVSASPTARPS